MNNKKPNRIDSFSWGTEGKPRHRRPDFSRSVPAGTPGINSRSKSSAKPAHSASVRPAPARRPGTPQKTEAKDVNISIRLSVPASFISKFKQIGPRLKSLKSIRKPSFRLPLKHRYFKMAAGGVLAIALVFGGWQAFKPQPAPPNEQEVQGIQNTEPVFEALVPSNKKEIEQRYDPQRKVISYGDTIGGVQITVSQQELPEAFKLDPQGSVEAMAKKFNATTPIQAGSITAYAGKSATGPQSVIFQKDGKLIFIYSPQELDQASLAAYLKILG